MDTLTQSSLVKELLDEYVQWWLGSPEAPGPVYPKQSFGVHPERSYNLKNKRLRKFLQHEEQKFGINLGWTDDAEPSTARKVARWFFARNSGTGPVKYGETIALGNGQDPSFIRYKERTVGINLDWSDSPVYEWKLLGGKIGQPVHTNEWIAIMNLKAAPGGELLIYFDRDAGGDIGWPSSRTWRQKIEDKLWKEAKDAAYKALIAAMAG